MIAEPKQSLANLYRADEVAWLDAMAELVRIGQHEGLDYIHLAEFLEDMSRRDRREVESRLSVLLAHLLKWTYQKKKRTAIWRRTVSTQRRELVRDFHSSKTLRNHADAVLADCYAEAVEMATDETGLAEEAFPAECPWTLEQLLSPEVLGER